MFYEKLRKEHLLWKTEIIWSFSRISVLFDSEVLNISGISEPAFISANPNSLPVLTIDNLQPFQQKMIIQYDLPPAEGYDLLCQPSGCYDGYIPFQVFT